MDDSASWLYEGARRVGKINQRAFPLRDLHGWGAPLIVKTEGGTESVMVPAVVDNGAGIFLPPLFINRTDPIFEMEGTGCTGARTSDSYLVGHSAAATVGS